MKQAKKDVTSAQPLPVLERYAKYFADPHTEPCNLLNDASMPLDGAIATVNAIAIGLSDEEDDLTTNPTQTSRILMSTYLALDLVHGMVNSAAVNLRNIKAAA